ncbi:MAG TPA: DUF6027 family protein [Terriglobales bacterium]|nr:DUF6027 family protein [Terriglobales bacterium]
MAPPDPHANFRSAVADSRLIDPMPTFRRLSETTGVPVEDLVHHALARWASAGSEALLFIGPEVLRDLVAARRAGDWAKVAGIVDWLQAGWEQTADR